jgi:uncharacterized membrane protein
VSEKSLQEELVELRQYVDWTNYRLGELEQQEAARTTTAIVKPASAPPAFVPAPAAAPVRQGMPQLLQTPAIAPREAVKMPTLEDLLTPARLAWAGGVILVVGICFLVSYGIRQGWITPEMRIALAAIVSVALGVGGFRIREAGDDGPVPLAMVAVSIAGLFATITAADSLYGMFGSTGLALGFAAAVTAAGAAVAVRWNSELLGGLAFVGVLLSPALIEAEFNTSLFGFCFAAFAATMVVCAMKGWRMLLLPALLIAVTSIAFCLGEASSPMLIVGWSAVWIAAQVGVSGPRVRGVYTESFSSDVGGAGTVLTAAIAVATGGYFELAENNEKLATAWIVALALVHLAIAGATYAKLIKQVRFAEIDAIIGVSLMAIGSAMIFNGPALVIAWCLQAAIATWCLGYEEENPSGVAIARLSAIGFIGLAVYQCVTFDAQTKLLSMSAGSIDTATQLNAMLALLAIIAVCALFGWRDRTEFRLAAMATGLTAAAYGTAICLDGTALVLAYCAGAAAIMALTRGRISEDGDEGLIGAVALITLAIVQVLQFEAPLRESLVTGLDDTLFAAVSLLAIAGAFGAVAWFAPKQHRLAAAGASALTLMYLCSALIINAFPPADGANLTGSLADQLSSGQQGQALVSAFWALIAFASIIVGLRRQIKELRIAGLVLLMVAIGKIVFIDLANLDAAYRTISFIAVGGVLLAVAFAFQRLRVAPEPVVELTEAV